MRSFPPRAALLLGVVLAGAACGGASGAAVAPKAAPSASKPASAAHDLPPGQIARADVDNRLQFGPPWLLQRVGIEEVLRQGKFVGWKLLRLPPDWSDFKVGDVVTQVNGKSLETPDDFFTAWTALATATEIRVALERDGATSEVVYPIVGAPSRSAADLEAAPPGAPKRAAQNRLDQTIVIEEEPPHGFFEEEN